MHDELSNAARLVVQLRGCHAALWPQPLNRPLLLQQLLSCCAGQGQSHASINCVLGQAECKAAVEQKIGREL